MPGSEAQDSSGYLLGEGGVCRVELAFVWHGVCLWLLLVFVPCCPVMDECFLYLASQPQEGGGEGGCRQECTSQFGKAVSFFIAGDVSVAQDPVNGDWVALVEEVCGSGIYVAYQFLAGACRKVGGLQDSGLVIREDVYHMAL
jgi:hypothetical protein